MSKSQDLFDRAQRLMPGGVNSPVRAFRKVGGTPFFTQSADGCMLRDVDGNEYIDYVCTWGPAIHGHNHPAIREALHAAVDRGTSFGTPAESEVEMAALLTLLVPSVKRVRMTNSGTEATMSAIRLSRGYTGRDKIIKFEGCYHGHSDSLLIKAGSGALTQGNPDSAGVPAAFAKETIVLPYNDPDAVEEAFEKWPDQIACIILEPYPANVGLLLPKRGYLRRLRDLCNRYGAVLIFDEVMTGFRLALGGVQELEAVTPDLTTMGKIIGGGLPVGAFGGKAEIMAHLAPEGPVYQAGTLSGNPLAMAAGLASLRLLKAEPPYARLHHAGMMLAGYLTEAAQAKGIPLQVPQVGSMFALFFTDKPVHNYDEAITGNADHFKKVFHYALEHGVYLPPSPYETCFISTAHDDTALHRTANVLCDAIKKL